MRKNHRLGKEFLMKTKLTIIDVKNNRKIEVSVGRGSEIYLVVSKKNIVNIFEKEENKDTLTPVINHPLDKEESVFVIGCESEE